MPLIRNVPLPPPAGLIPVAHCRNGVVTDGAGLAGFTSFVNMLTGRRGCRILFSDFSALHSPLAITGAKRLRFRTSPNVFRVNVLMLVSRPATSNFVSYEWTVGGVAQGARQLGGVSAAVFGSTSHLSFDHYSFVDGSGDDLAGNTVFDASVLSSSSATRIVGYVIYEQWRGGISCDEDGIDERVSSVGAPILASQVEAVSEQLWGLYKNTGNHYIRHSDDNAGGTGTIVTGSTVTNLLDAATTAYDATVDAGFWVYPEKQNTLTGSTVGVTFWCYASASTANGKVRFINSAGTLATISVTGGAAYYSTTGTMSSTPDSELVTVHGFNSSGGGATVTVHGFGMYALTT